MFYDEYSTSYNYDPFFCPSAHEFALYECGFSSDSPSFGEYECGCDYDWTDL